MRRNLLHLMMFQVVIGWAKQTIKFSCIGKAREKVPQKKGDTTPQPMPCT